ncbi:hypothetical protein LXL04_036528 [Taraxacum kok-saghyz]
MGNFVGRQSPSYDTVLKHVNKFFLIKDKYYKLHNLSPFTLPLIHPSMSTKSVDAIINGSISVSSSDPYPFSSSATRAQQTWELAPVAPSMAKLSSSGSSLDGFCRRKLRLSTGHSRLLQPGINFSFYQSRCTSSGWFVLQIRKWKLCSMGNRPSEADESNANQDIVVGDSSNQTYQHAPHDTNVTTQNFPVIDVNLPFVEIIVAYRMRRRTSSSSHIHPTPPLELKKLQLSGGLGGGYFARTSDVSRGV